MKIKMLPVMLVITTLLSACTSAQPITAVNNSQSSEYIDKQPAENKSLVYIARIAKNHTSVTYHSIDGNELGPINNNDQFLMVELDPGTHTFRYASNANMAGTYSETAFSIEANEKKLILYKESYNANSIKSLPFTFRASFLKSKQMIAFQQISASDIAQMYAQKKEEEQRIEELRQQNIAYLNELINKGQKDEFMTFLDNYPSLAEHIQNPTYRLLFTGPKDLRIGKIAKLLEHGFGEEVVIAKINGVKEPYRDFSIDELLLLKELKFSDKIIAAMMNVTTELSKEQERIAREDALLEEQRKIAQEMKNSQARITTAQSQSAGGNEFMNAAGQEVGKAVGKEIGKALLDNLF